MMGVPLGEKPKLRTYRRIAELGRGGMANVYLAAMRGPHSFTKLVVIKELKSELADDPDFHTMFMDEARLAARLNHPNIVQTYEVNDDQGGPVIIMEYLEGQPLHRIWSSVSRKEMPLAAQLYVVSNVLQGLEYANALKDFDGTPLNVVHRDISPHNIFITYSGEVKIVDFGIAKASDSSSKTEVGTLKGKLAYMPPEQAQGESVDQRADIFSVGVVLWEAAVGRRLWKGLKDVAILHHLLSGTIPSPRSLNDQVSERLDAVIMRALELDREKRYTTAADFQKDIDALIDEMPERFHRRELGTVISDAFVGERTRIRKAIEEQLKLARVVATGEIQTVDLAAQSQHPNSSGNFSMAPPPVLIPMPPPSVPSVAQLMVSPLSPLGYAHVPGDSSSIGPPMAMPVPPPKRSALTAVLFGALAVLLPASAFATFKALQTAPPSTGTTSGATVTDTATPHASATGAGAGASIGTSIGAPSKTRVVVHARPADALLFLDGEKVTTTDGVLTRDDHGSHKLRAERSGFVTKEITVSFDKDLALEVVLDPKPPTRSTPTGGGPRTGPTPPPPGKAPETPDLGY
jgi:eukaryotic-like serine/threonine-protein kinase